MAMSPTKSQTGSRSFTRALALAFNEWLLMLMLFANSIFIYVITRFADYSELQSPCLMCTRLDHILGKTKHLNKKTHWDMICSKHKSEISSLVYCHAHGKLVDVRGMCETCLFSFATTNKSNAETYRLLVGKLGEDTSCFGSKSDQSMNPRYCTCCNQLCMPQTASTQVAKPETLPKIRLRSGLSTGKQSTTPKKSVSFNDLPHVGYTELKFHSDTESEAVFSEDEGLVKEEHHHKFQTMNLDIPPVITLPYDLATDKLLNLDFSLKHLHEIGLGTNSLFPELIPVSDMPETSEKVLKEEEIISLDNLFLTSRAMDHFGAVLEEKEELMLFNDSKMKETVLIPINGVPETSEKVLKEETSRAMERCAAVLEENEEWIRFNDVSLTPDALLEETELIPVNDVPETSEKVLKEEDIISFDNPFLTPRTTEYSAVILEEKEELIRLNDVSLTPIFKEIPEDALMEETELICLNDVTSTSVAAETPEDVLKGTELISLHDISLADVPESSTTNETSAEMSKESDTNQADITSLESEDTKSMHENSTENCKDSEKVVKEEDVSEKVVKEEDSLDNIFLTSRAMEPSAVVLEETEEDLIHLQDDSLKPHFKDISEETEETELICLNDVTSTSSDAAETPEDVLKGIELMSLHDTSLEEVPESFTTNATSVEIPKESDTNQDDINSLESEYIVVSPTKSMPESSTEYCASENKEMEETSLTVSSVSEMAPPVVTPHIEPPPESESSSFNSMSVAAETNRDSGELMDLADAYNNIVSNEGKKDSNGAQIEQWMKKDTSRVSEDLKALLTQISASRGIEFLSPRDISPRICSDQETKDLDHDMQLLLQKRMLERNESNLSLEGVSVSEIEGESESDRLKRQVDHDRKLLSGLYKELEEERSASAVATNQAMAMITRLQEEKALFQMEALQNLRMMEEQAEYDMEAIQKLNDLLVEREKLIQDLEAEIDYFRDQTPQKKNTLDVAENVTGIDSPSERMSNKIQNCLTGFNEERLYITSFLEKIENRVVNGEAHVDNLATQESISELHERVENLNGDLYFLEQVVNSLGHGNEGVQFVKEIASHLQTLRSLSMKRQDHTES